MGSKSRFEQEQTAKEYEAYYETKYKRADLLEKKLLTKLFSQFPDAKNVLEVGCGTGHFTRWIESDLGIGMLSALTHQKLCLRKQKNGGLKDLLQSEGANYR